MSRRIRSQTEPLPGKPSLRRRGGWTERRAFSTSEFYVVGYRKPPKVTQQGRVRQQERPPQRRQEYCDRAE